MSLQSRIEEPRNQFPVGMRVLAVDDDPTCLRLLETLLRRCRYHVTTTSHAITALKLLRDNKDKFDLVISDVHMPDMDGFKLLELVGLEMDLPVIMLSANGDPKLVMKGITHGACDYLLKPVRIEELKNIWQHVIRRKKFDSRDHSCFSNQDKPQNETGEGLVSSNAGSYDGKPNKRRKEQSENEIEENDKNEDDNEDLSSQKKPRVVWSVELHQKFVAAVNQLGIDKAVPKKILDSMNVENLTRENVASHLQKYRLYLKRISSVASQQANMVAAFGNADFPYLRNYHSFPGSAQFQRTLGSFPPSGMLGRLNTSTGNIHGPYSPRMVQLGHAQNARNHINDWRKFQSVLLPGHQNGSMHQGTPTPIQVDQLLQNKGVGCIGDFPTTIDDSRIFSASGAFLNTKTLGSSNSSLVSAPNNPFSLQEHPRGTQNRQQLGSQSSVIVHSSNTEYSSNLPSSLPVADSLKQPILNPSSMRDDISYTTPLIESHPCVVSSVTRGPPLLQDSRTSLQGQTAPATSNARENMECSPNQGWDDPKKDDSIHSNVIFNSLHSASPSFGVVCPLDPSFESNNANSHRNMDSNFTAPQNSVDSLSMQSDVGSTLKLKQGYLDGQWKPQNIYSSDSVGSLEDLVGAMMKQDQANKFNLMDEEFGLDAYSIGTCI